MTGITLKSLVLNHFRSYKKELLTFSSRGCIFTGSNGSGKTNILEAISLFSPGKGLRKAKSHEISRKPENLGWKAKGIFKQLDNLFEIEVSFTGHGEKAIFLDGKKISQSKMNELLKILWITPQMDRLWSSGAVERRNFIDRITYSFQSDHARIILSYEKLVRERNELFRIGGFENNWMDVLENQIVDMGIKIYQNRLETINMLNDSSNQKTGFPKPKLEIIGENFIDKISYLTHLKNSRKKDSFSCRTSVGPHKSDLNLIYIDKGIDARDCSTGEQKALLVSTILSISREIIKKYGVKPILLLDEVGAHLDDARRSNLISQLEELKVQFFVTATELNFFKSDNHDIKFLKVSNNGDNSYLN